jgi:hypothetical protein
LILSRPKHEVEERTRAIRADFARRYNLDELREQLYREQEGICAICTKPIQDSCGAICAVDHAISVYMIANWGWKTEKAIEVANARCNLLAVHVACNSQKREADYEELIEQIQRGEIVLGQVQLLTADQIAVLVDASKERARKAGRASGKKHVENGFDFVKLGKIGGKLGGKISGPMSRTIYVIDGKLTCSNCKASKPISEFGKTKRGPSGYRGWCSLCRSEKEYLPVADAKKKALRAKYETDAAFREYAKSKAAQRYVPSKLGRSHGQHVRRHINKGIVSSTCKFCQQSAA